MRRTLDAEIIIGLALAAMIAGFGAMAAGLAAGGSLPIIGLGLILAAFSMDLLRIARR